MYFTFVVKQQRQPQKSVSIDDLFREEVEVSPQYLGNYFQTRTVIFRDHEAFPASAIARAKKLQPIINSLSLEISHYLSHSDLTYTTFKIPKASGGLRTIEAPNEYLKNFQRHVKDVLSLQMGIQHHDCSHAYIKNRSTVTALKVHQARNPNWFLKLDIKNFFPSCTRAFIVQQLKQIYPFTHLDCDDFLANLARIATNEEGTLPQGTPLSPFLTNILFLPYDYRIRQMCNHQNPKLIYTRYADDLLLSAYESFRYNEITTKIQAILQGSPFELKKEKTRYGSKAGRNWNLGLMLNKDNNITIGYRKKRILKAMVHNYLYNRTEWSLNEVQELLGQVSYFEMVEPKCAKQFLTAAERKYNVPIKADLIRTIKELS